MSCEQILSNRISNRLSDLIYNKNSYDNVKQEIITDTLDCRLKERNKYFLRKRTFRKNVFDDIKVKSIECYLGVLNIEQYKSIQKGEYDVYNEYNNQYVNEFINLVKERKCLKRKNNSADSSSDTHIEQLVYLIIKYIDGSVVEFQYEALRTLNVIIKNKLCSFKEIFTSKLPPFTLNKIITFLNSNITELINTTIKFLSNVHDNTIRSIIIENSIYQQLILLYSTNENISILTNSLKCLQTIILIPEVLPYSKVFTIFNHTIKHILTICNDKMHLNFLLIAFEFLDHITNLYKESLSELIESDLIINDVILKYAYQNDNDEIKIRATRIIGNITLGNANETEVVTKFQYIQLFKLNLQHSIVKIREETAWLISNIVCDVEKHKELFIENGFFDMMKEMIYKETRNSVLKQIIWVLCNMLTVRNENIYIKLIYENGGIDLVEQMFNIGEEDPYVICVVIELMKNILEKEEATQFFYNKNSLYFRLVRIGIKERFEKILMNTKTICSEQINFILNKYLNNDDE